jgi:HlyD family secretion protein
MNAHVKEPPPPLRDFVPELPEELAKLVERMLAKNPADRPATPRDVAAALEPFRETAALPELISKALTLPPECWAKAEKSRDANFFTPRPTTAPNRRRPIVRNLLIGMGFFGAILLAFGAGILITIKREGKPDTNLEIPEGSKFSMNAQGNVQIGLAPGEAQDYVMIDLTAKDGKATLPPQPYKIGLGDYLFIRAVYALPDQPIDGTYRVEPEGTVALAPAYGRIKVVGLSLVDAEQAVRTKLSEILQAPEVSVTLAGWRKRDLAVPPPLPHRIMPGDILNLWASYALPEQSIHGPYLVEPDGQLTLGPAYGRVQLKGLTFEEAEKVVRDKLAEILANSEISITLEGWRKMVKETPSSRGKVVDVPEKRTEPKPPSQPLDLSKKNFEPKLPPIKDVPKPDIKARDIIEGKPIVPGLPPENNAPSKAIPTLIPQKNALPKAPPLQFGPVTERVINSLTDEKNAQGLDLAGGKLIAAPKEALVSPMYPPILSDPNAAPPKKARMSPPTFKDRWTKENNVDLFFVAGVDPFSRYGSKSIFLLPLEMKLAAVPNRFWNDLGESDLRQLVESETPGLVVEDGGIIANVRESQGLVAYELTDTPPLTFAFQTRKGDLGLLQIVRYTEDPRGMRIRYKLVRNDQIKVFTLAYADATAMVKLLTEILDGSQTPGRTNLRLSVDTRNNHIIAKGDPDTLSIAEAILLRLDGADTRTRMPPPALPPSGLIPAKPGEQKPPASPNPTTDEKLSVVAYHLNRLDPEVALDAMKAFFSGEANIRFALDRDKNLLVVAAPRPQLERTREVFDLIVKLQTATDKKEDSAKSVSPTSGTPPSKPADQSAEIPLSQAIAELNARLAYHPELQNPRPLTEDEVISGVRSYLSSGKSFPHKALPGLKSLVDSRKLPGGFRLVEQWNISQRIELKIYLKISVDGSPESITIRSEAINVSPSYKTAKITRGDITSTITASGTIQPEDMVDVAAQVSGRIVELGPDPRGKSDPKFKDKFVDFNTPVAKGDLLARIDDEAYKDRVELAKSAYQRADAEFRQAEAKSELAKAEVDAALKSNQKVPGSVPDSALKTLQTNVIVAKAALQAAVADTQKALNEEKVAKRNLAYTEIRLPLDGVVIARRVNPGQHVSEGKNGSLFLIAKGLDKMQIQVDVKESDLGRIREGMDATFTVEAFPNEVFKAKVTQIRANTQEIQTGYFPVVLSFENPGKKLLPYMRAMVRFEIPLRQNVLRVPSAALIWKPKSDQIADEYGRKNILSTPLWIKDGVGTHVISVKGVQVGLPRSDGEGVEVGLWGPDGMTEVSGPNVREGMEIVVGENRPSNSSPATQQPGLDNVFVNPPATVPYQSPRPITPEEGAFQGDWIAVTQIEDGKPISLPAGESIKGGVFDDNRILLTTDADSSSPTFQVSGGFTLDETTRPKRISISAAVMVMGKYTPDQQLNGIYKIDRYRLTIAYRRNGPAPDKFESTPGSGVTVVELKRQERKSADGAVPMPAAPPPIPTPNESIPGAIINTVPPPPLTNPNNPPNSQATEKPPAATPPKKSDEHMR